MKKLTQKTQFMMILVGFFLAGTAQAQQQAPRVNNQFLQEFAQKQIQNLKKTNPTSGEGHESYKKLQKLQELKLEAETKMLKDTPRLKFGGNSGGGGDEIGLEFQATLVSALEDFQRTMPQIYDILNELKLAEQIPNIKIIAIDNPLDVGVAEYIQDSTAVNLPQSRIILVNRDKWKNVTTQKVRNGIALHELFSLNTLESTGVYTYSSQYLLAHNVPTDQLVTSLSVNRARQIDVLDNNMPLVLSMKPFEPDYRFKTPSCYLEATLKRDVKFKPRQKFIVASPGGFYYRPALGEPRARDSQEAIDAVDKHTSRCQASFRNSEDESTPAARDSFKIYPAGTQFFLTHVSDDKSFILNLFRDIRFISLHGIDFALRCGSINPEVKTVTLGDIKTSLQALVDIRMVCPLR